MRQDNYDVYAQPNLMRIGHRDVKKDMPSREELIARNSFGSPNDNKYLNAPRAAEIARKERELAQLKGKGK